MIAPTMSEGTSPENAPGADRELRRPRRRRRRNPVFRFVVVLVLLMVGFNALFYCWLSYTKAFESYLALNASVSAKVLCFLGEHARSSGEHLTSPRFSLTIKRGCDALQASFFFALLVIASPLTVPIRNRIVWMVGGTMLLLFINLVRIISLYYTGVWYPSMFEVMHVEVWQVAYIVMPILLWLYWIRRVSKRPVGRTDASA